MPRYSRSPPTSSLQASVCPKMSILSRSSSIITGLAQDVIIITPSTATAAATATATATVTATATATAAAAATQSLSLEDAAVVSCSDFIVQFISSSSSGTSRLSPTTSISINNSCDNELVSSNTINKTTTTTSRSNSILSTNTTSSTKTTSNSKNNKISRSKGIVKLKINDVYVPELLMTCNTKEYNGYCHFYNNNKSSKPDSSVLASLVERGIMVPGKNTIKYIYEVVLLSSDDEGEKFGYYNKIIDENSIHTSALGITECFVYVWSSCDSVIISDIDGTVTKSDIKGVYDTIISEAYEYAHTGICKFFSKLSHCSILHNNTSSSLSSDEKKSRETTSTTTSSIRFVYLTARPISLITSTRKYIHSLTQSSEGNHLLPQGPIFCHKGSLSQVLYQELFAKDMDKFKSGVLSQQVLIPFSNAGKKENVFLAAFGNKSTDAFAYEKAGLELDDIYIINKKSEIMCLGHCANTHNLNYTNNNNPVIAVSSVDDEGFDSLDKKKQIVETSRRIDENKTTSSLLPFHIFKKASIWKRLVTTSTTTSTPPPSQQQRKICPPQRELKRSVSNISFKYSQYTKELYKSYNDPRLYDETLSKLQFKFISSSKENNSYKNINEKSNGTISYTSMEGTEILKCHLSTSPTKDTTKKKIDGIN